MEERINIVIREDGTVVVQRKIADLGDELDNSGKKAKKFGDQINTVQNVLRSFMGLIAVNELRKYADSWTVMTNRIALNTATQAESNAVMERLYASAQKARSSLDGLTSLYQRGAQASRELGASQEQLLQFTEGVGLAIAVQGTNADKAREMLLQLGQALGSPRVMTEEFNSVLEATPRILKAVADNLDGAGGSIARLKDMVKDGQVSNVEFFNSFMAGIKDIEAEFAKARPTFSQAFTVLNNAMAKFIGETDASIGVTDILARAIMNLGNNLETLAGILVTVAAGWAAYRSPIVIEWLLAAKAGVNGLTAAIAANPLGAFAVAITAAATALTVFRDSIVVNQEAGLTLGDYMWSLGQTIKSVVGQGMSDLGDLWDEFWEGKGNIEVVVTWLEVMGAVFKTVANGMIATAVGLWKTLYSLWDKGSIAIAATLEGAWVNMSNKIIDFVNFNINWINVMLRAAGQATIDPIEMFKMPQIGAAWKDLSREIAGNFDYTYDYIKAGADGVKGVIDELTLGAAVRAAGRNKGNDVDLNKTPPAMPAISEADDKANKKAARELERLRNAYESLRASIDPIWGAQQRLAEGTDLLNAALQKGWIDTGQYTDLLLALGDSLEDALNPMKAYQKEYEEMIRLSQLGTREREVEMETEKAIQQLRKAGVIDADKYRNQLREQYTTLQKLNDLQAARNQLAQETTEVTRALEARQAALNEAYKQGTIGLEAYLTKSRQVMVDHAAQQNENGFGNTMSVMRESMGQFLDDYTTLASGMADIVGNMMSSLGDGISDSLANAIVKGEDLQATMSNLAQTILTEMLSAIIKLGIQWAINTAMGQTAAATNTAMSVAMGSAVAAAWAPAAAAVSLATLGSNAPLAIAGMAQAYAASSFFSMLPGFQYGGQFDVGGSGGTDSQLVAFRASPNERVTVETPHQQNQSDKDGSGETNIAIVNVTSEEEIYAALSTARGSRIIMNVIERNPQKIQKISQGG